MNATFNLLEKRRRTMKQNKSVFSALMLAGILGLSASPGWGQAKPGSSGPMQRDEGATTGQSSGQMKSSSGAKSTDSGDQSSGRAIRERWGKQDIKKIQEALKDKGNDPGPVDGVVGPQTQKALRAFQQANGLKTTGRLDAETAKALGVEPGSSPAMGSGSSMEKASSTQEPSRSPINKEPSSKSNR
jgi:hypothetical protein